MPGRNAIAALIAIAALVAVVDQVTKSMIVTMIGPGREQTRIDLAGTWLALEYAENRGMAFGLLPGLGPFLLPAAGIILVGLLIHYMRESCPPIWQTVAMGLIAGGALGNLIDRFRFGYVVDFVAVGAWPNFNVADSAIVCGVALLIWGWMFSEPRAHAVRAR